MNRSLCSRFAAAALFVTAALGAATAAQAHTEVQFSIGIPARPVYADPEPVYVLPTPVYVRPAPVYVRPAPVYVEPRPVYVEPRPVYVPPPAYVYERGWQPSYESGYEREQAWRHAEWHKRQWGHRHHGWDRSPAYGRDRD